MKLLLDTHAALWFSGGDPRLSAKAREEIAAPGNEKYVSIASLWEIAIKHSAGKFHLNEPIELFLPRLLTETGCELLEISVRHVSQVAKLPWHHRDPFDRILIAQADCEDCTVVGSDVQFDAYSCRRIW